MRMQMAGADRSLPVLLNIQGSITYKDNDFIPTFSAVSEMPNWMSSDQVMNELFKQTKFRTSIIQHG